MLWGYTAAGAIVTTTMKAPGYNKNFTTTAGTNGTWRQKLPPMLASKTAFDFTMSSSNSSSEKAVMMDVLFGDVYICGGQSSTRP